MTCSLIKCWLLVGCVGLVSCADPSHEELKNWMADQRSGLKPRVTPVAEPRSFEPHPYGSSEKLDPFDRKKLAMGGATEPVSVTSQTAAVQRELKRTKGFLETAPLDAFSLVGRLKKSGKEVALLKLEKSIYQVGVGSYIGQNHGLITRISEKELTVRELIQEESGEWIERMAVLQIQEKSQ